MKSILLLSLLVSLNSYAETSKAQGGYIRHFGTNGYGYTKPIPSQVNTKPIMSAADLLKPILPENPVKIETVQAAPSVQSRQGMFSNLKGYKPISNQKPSYTQGAQ